MRRQLRSALLPYQGETGRLSASLMIPRGEASVKCWGFQVRAQCEGKAWGLHGGSEEAPFHLLLPAPTLLLAPPLHYLPCLLLLAWAEG